MIGLIDYKAGNLTSVRKALAAVGADVFTPVTPRDLLRARGIIVPGVGHFGATRTLDEPWVSTIRELVENHLPLLGICLGMQWLFDGSDEAPDVPGLGLLAGRCYRLGESGDAVKVPHVGWNSIEFLAPRSICRGVTGGSQVYFTHSYVAPMTEDAAAATEHGAKFASIVQRGHIAGVQFHPEKSGEIGLTILRNFIEWCSDAC